MVTRIGEGRLNEVRLGQLAEKIANGTLKPSDPLLLKHFDPAKLPEFQRIISSNRGVSAGRFANSADQYLKGSSDQVGRFYNSFKQLAKIDPNLAMRALKEIVNQGKKAEGR